jgi:hypothetical protein
LSTKRQGELTRTITRLNPEFRRSDTGGNVDGIGRDVFDNDCRGAVFVVNVMVVVDRIGWGTVVVNARRDDLIVNVHRLRGSVHWRISGGI